MRHGPVKSILDLQYLPLCPHRGLIQNLVCFLTITVESGWRGGLEERLPRDPAAPDDLCACVSRSARPAVGAACRPGPCSAWRGAGRPWAASCTRSPPPPWPATPTSAPSQRRKVSVWSPSAWPWHLGVGLSRVWSGSLVGPRKWGVRG